MPKSPPVKKSIKVKKGPKVEEKPWNKYTEPNLPIFRDFSAILTGFSPEDLEEKGMLEAYYYTIMKEDDDDEHVRNFFLKAKEVLEKSPAVQKKFLKKLIPDQHVKPGEQGTPLDLLPYQGLAQRIILMWYTGNWTTMNGLKKELAELQELIKQKKKKDPNERNEFGRTAAVSAEAYKNGLIWTVAETHPAGAKQPGYASWSIEPLYKGGFNHGRK